MRKFAGAMEQFHSGYIGLRSVSILTMAFALLAATAYAKQGAVRALYTVPNMAFVEQPSGETVIRPKSIMPATPIPVM